MSSRACGDAIGDGDAERAVLDGGADLDLGRCARAGDAVLDRIFDERLDEEARHQRLAGVGRAIDRDVEPLAEADALDLEIFLGQRQLVVERDELGRIGVERAPAGSSTDLSVIASASWLRPVTISAEIEFSELNRKCGLSW